MPQKPTSSKQSGEPSKDNSLEVYNTIAETVGGIPSLRKQDNLFQAIFIAGGTLLGAGIGWGIGQTQGALIGSLIALIGSTLLSGIGLMVLGWVRALTTLSRQSSTPLSASSTATSNSPNPSDSIAPANSPNPAEPAIANPDQPALPVKRPDQTVYNLILAVHLSALAGWFLPVPAVGGSLIVPLVIWLTQKERDVKLNEHGKESVNFQLSICIYKLIVYGIERLASGLFEKKIPEIVPNSGEIFNAVIVGFLFLLPWAVLEIFNAIAVIVAAVKASDRQFYRYPLNLRLIKS